MSEAVGRKALVRVATLSELKDRGCMVLNAGGNNFALFYQAGQVYAVDNRCPHMGFPLERGTVKDGILTCHWHHARFDLASGGTFDLFADDVRSFPVEIRGDEVWVDVSPRADMRADHSRRLKDGLERNIPLVIAKSVIALTDSDTSASEPFRIGLDFGVRYRQAGWGQGLTILTCMMNLLPHLAMEDRSRALYHGLSAVARDCDSAPPRFTVNPLPGSTTDPFTLKRWFRQFVEVRDAEGAERCVVSAVRTGMAPQRIADMLFTAATDHRYIQTGHVLDFTNKALQALDIAGWEPQRAEVVLASLSSAYANADRMEESNSWRNPLDLVLILQRASERLPDCLAQGALQAKSAWAGQKKLVTAVRGEDPQAIADALLAALAQGATPEQVAGCVTYAAALRIARFHTSNEFGDWDTALHTFTFANAVQMGLRRSASVDLLRGVFDAAISVYLERFLNVPPARLPVPDGNASPDQVLTELPTLLNRQQQVDQAGELVAGYMYHDGKPEHLLALLGKLLLREDRDFHTIQTMEAAIQQYELLRGSPQAVHVLVAAARYLAAHAPTMRAQGQTFQIALRLSRGEKLFEG
jgi:nitrite reductase/ring-hydroxylating ferredoxin subunit